jgi:hypothetical protein
MDRWNAIFIMTFSLMQVIDFILWWMFDSGDFTNSINYYLSKYLIPIILVLELVAVYFGSKLYKNNNNFNGLWQQIYSDFMHSLYPKILIIVIIWMLWFNITHNNNTIVGKDGGLIWGNSSIQQGIWKYVSGFIFILFLIYPYLEYVPTKPSANIIVLFLILSLSYSFIMGSHWGSYWCWIANILSVICLGLPYLF